MLKPLFGWDFGAFPIYATMVLIGFFVALWLLSANLKTANYSPFMRKRVRRSFFWGALIGLLCANLANWFLFEGMLDLSVYARLTQGGFSFLFGLIPFLLFSALFLRLYKVDIMPAMRLVVGPVLIAHFFGRLGCSLRGCCWGESMMLGDTQVLLPIREIEAVSLLIMGIVIPKKSKEKTLWVYLFTYSILRFVLEFFRGDHRGSLFGITVLSPSQLICIILFIISSCALFLRSFLAALHKEAALDALLEKLRFFRKKENPYTPRPEDFQEPAGTRHPVRLTLQIIAIVLVVALLIVYINPTQSGWLYNLQYKFQDLLSVFTFGNRTQKVIGDSNGTELIPLSGDAPVDLQSGLALVSASDPWANATFAPAGEKTLDSGAKLLFYYQTVDGKPVLGTTRVLITDEQSRPLYLISDAAGLGFASNQVDRYTANGKTLKELLGYQVQIAETLSCWYDTGEGLLAAEHVLFRTSQNGDLLGAVLQASDKALICFTQAELGVFSTQQRNDLVQDAANAISQLEGHLAPVAAKTSDGPSIVLLSNTVAVSDLSDPESIAQQYIQLLQQKAEGLTVTQCVAILCSVRDVLRVSPSANPKLYCEILLQQTRQVMSTLDFSQQEIDEVINYLSNYLKQYYPAQTDEVAMELQAERYAKTFTYGIQYQQDADIYRVLGQDEHSLEITVKTGVPVKVEICDAFGKAVTSMFVEQEETFTLYPEDGTEFILRVKAPDLGILDWSSQYQITLQTQKQTVEIPGAVRTALYRVESAYNSSNGVAFLSLYKDENYTLLEGMAAASLLPVMDACSGMMTQNDQVDYAKAVIAEAMLRQNMTTQDMERMRGTEMQISYVRHIEQDGCYLVKAHIRISKDELLYCSGYSLFRLQPLKEGDLPVEVQDVQDYLGLVNADYYITESNTDALLEAFGESREDLVGSSDLTSMYRLCTETNVYIDDALSIDQITFDWSLAQRFGHSQKKIDAFEKYVVRQNLSILRFQYKSARYNAQLYGSIATIYDVFNLLSDPTGALIDGLDNELISKSYEIYEACTDFEGVVKDGLTSAVIDPLINNYRARAELMEKRCDILLPMINECEELLNS